MTADIEAIRARAEAATPGTWRADRGTVWRSECDCNESPCACVYVAEDCTWADAEFIAHARTDIPLLLAELDRVAGEANWLADVVETNRAIHQHVAAERDSLAAVVASVRELADEWASWAEFRSTPRINAFRDASEQIRAALIPTTTETEDES